MMEAKDYDYFPVIAAEELPNGERIFIDIDDEPVVIFNIGGYFYAIADRCTHDDGPLGEGELEGFEIACPRHGARFDVRDGKVLSMPAFEDTEYFPTRVQDGMLEIGVPKE